MAELTDEQVDRAAKAHFDCGAIPSWDGASEQTKDAWRKSIRAAAPFLQLPWEPPTFEDINEATYQYGKLSRSGYDTKDNPPPNTYAMTSALQEFVRRRNAALMPKPDPRLHKVICAMSGFTSDRKLEDTIAKQILAALDEVDQ